MKALILAGGFGTRLRPLSCTRPKILLPIVNKPLLQWTYERLAKHKISEVILAVNSQTEISIKQIKIPRGNIRVRYSLDPRGKPLGSGGPIKKAERQIGSDSPFLVLNGDIFAEMDYDDLLKTHRKKKALATIALHPVRDTRRYGVAKLSKNGRVRAFIEKPPPGSVKSDLINAGAYVLDLEVFKHFPKAKAFSIEREVFPKLAKEGKLYGHVCEGLWTDIGKPEDYLRINKVLLGFSARQREPKGNAVVRRPVAFGRGVHIGKKSIIGPYVVLGRNVKIGKNANVRNSVILPETVVSDSASIGGAIIGECVVIGKRAKIDGGCIVGDHAKVGAGINLAKGVYVCPAKEISESVLRSGIVC